MQEIHFICFACCLTRFIICLFVKIKLTPTAKGWQIEMGDAGKEREDH